MGMCPFTLPRRHWSDEYYRLQFAFPKEMAAREKEFPLIFGTFVPSFKSEKGIKEYLASDRRQKYSMGIYRHYPELDRQ